MEKNKENDELFEIILKLESIDDCYSFFDDLCTYKEIEAMSNRLKAAKLLLEGKTYEQVIQEAMISSATLSRVSKCIRFGKGYNKFLNDKK